MTAFTAGVSRSYWTATGSFESVTKYINMNFDGLRDGIVEMLAGGRERVDPTRFQNDMSIVKNRDDYHMIRELPTGKGYADIVFLPRKNVAKPALVIELKKDSSAHAAIGQIKERRYPQQVAHYSGDMLLVGISYDEATKKHSCQIEPWRKDS